MALYDGFFDAALNDDGTYDRTYSAVDFVEYFNSFIGSGVCVANNADSMKVSWNNGKAIVAPGYLFINGYWLKNDADYTIPLTGSGTFVIVAKLSTANRNITLTSQSNTTTSIANGLILARVTPSNGTVTDTRYDTDICGVIDSAGSLSNKVAYVLDYIENTVEKRLAEVEGNITDGLDAAQNQLDGKSREIDGKIADAQAELDKITPPAVGTVKYSLGNPGEKWLRCDGHYISGTTYPELVELLRKSGLGETVTLLSEGEIGKNITNGVIFADRMWVFSYAEKKLYGFLLSGGNIKTISVTSSSAYFAELSNPSVQNLALSITDDNTLFLAGPYIFQKKNFTGNESSVQLTLAVSDNISSADSETYSIPYVSRITHEGVSKYYIALGQSVTGSESWYRQRNVYYGSWSSGDNTLTRTSIIADRARAYASGTTYILSDFTLNRYSFNRKNRGEMADFRYLSGTSDDGYNIGSLPQNIYGKSVNISTVRSYASNNCTTIFGKTEILVSAAMASKTRITSSFVNSDTGQTGAVNTAIELPENSTKIFPDAACYLYDEALWVIFVGSGILFTPTLSDADSYGFIDTTGILGIITQFGYLEYDETRKCLYILGQNSMGNVALASCKLPDFFSYSSTGAFLPKITVGSVPAYIKAIEG